MALVWRDTVPDAVLSNRSQGCCVTLLLHFYQEPTRKCIKIPESSFTVQFRVLL